MQKLKKLNVLIIDDDEEDIFLLRKMIQSVMEEGFGCEFATDFENGIDVLQKVQYDVCFLDYRLGKRDGIELLKTVHDVKKRGPVILLTGQGDEKVAVQALKSGATDYLTKDNLSSYRLYTSICTSQKIFREEQDRVIAEAALKESEQKLMQVNFELEERIRERTAALENSNKRLKERSATLDELNTALKVLIKKKDENQIELEEKMAANIKQLIWPQIQKLKTDMISNEQRQAIFETIEFNLREIVSPLAALLTSAQFGLTPMQIRIANFIKQGRTSKEISSILNVSKGTVETHRNNIRIKLNLKNKKINLQSYLGALN